MTIRVLVVEDSLTVRRRIVDALGAAPGIEVVGEAADGRSGVELCEKLRPDVATFDMMLPELDGLAATEHIMAYFPTPILIVSASINRGELFKTYDALAAGAVDVLDKPGLCEDDRGWDRKLVTAIKVVSGIKVITHPRARFRDRARGRTEPAPRWDHGQPAGPGTPRLVAVGASTGGPGAVLDVLRGLPRSFPLPILLVIHIGKPFAAALAEWLGRESHFRVEQATHGEPIPAAGEPRVLLAPADRHLVVERGRVLLTEDPERNSCRPSVDVLFESVAREAGPRACGCLLTGMGKDGAEGLLSMRRTGATTLAQDEASSVVFGMPREAILLGAASRVVSLDQIAPALVAFAGGDGAGWGP